MNKWLTFINLIYHNIWNKLDIFFKIEEASKQISKAIQEVKDKALLAEYEQKVSSDILNWIKQKMEWMQKGKVKESREENYKKQAEFDEYLRVEKAEKLKQVAQFEEQYKSLKERLSSGGQELQTVTPTVIHIFLKNQWR